MFGLLALKLPPAIAVRRTGQRRQAGRPNPSDPFGKLRAGTSTSLRTCLKGGTERLPRASPSQRLRRIATPRQVVARNDTGMENPMAITRDATAPVENAGKTRRLVDNARIVDRRAFPVLLLHKVADCDCLTL